MALKEEKVREPWGDGGDPIKRREVRRTGGSGESLKANMKAKNTNDQKRINLKVRGNVKASGLISSLLYYSHLDDFRNLQMYCRSESKVSRNVIQYSPLGIELLVPAYCPFFLLEPSFDDLLVPSLQALSASRRYETAP